MFFDVKQLELGRVRFHQTLEPGAIEFLDPQLHQATNLETEGTAELKTSTMEIDIRGHLKVRMEADCDRCLELARFPIDIDFDLTYRPAGNPDRIGELALNERDTDVGYYEGTGLELTDVLREQVLLALPMQRVCSEDCQGICPVCGQNRNRTACSCHQEGIDDRWAGLRNLK